MSAISNSGGGQIWCPTAPQFSFWEYRAPGFVLINPVFVSLGHGRWEYKQGRYTADITMPCWDKDYDWEAASARVKARSKPYFPFLSRM